MLNLIKMISDLRKEVEALRKEVQTLKDALAKQKRDYNDLLYNLDVDNAPALNNPILTNTKTINDTDGKKKLTISVPNANKGATTIIAETVSNSDGSDGVLITVPSADKKTEAYIEIFAGSISMSAKKDGVSVSRIVTGDNVAFMYAAGNAVTVDKNGVKVTTPNGEKFL